MKRCRGQKWFARFLFLLGTLSELKKKYNFSCFLTVTFFFFLKLQSSKTPQMKACEVHHSIRTPRSNNNSHMVSPKSFYAKSIISFMGGLPVLYLRQSCWKLVWKKILRRIISRDTPFMIGWVGMGRAYFLQVSRLATCESWFFYNEPRVCEPSLVYLIYKIWQNASLKPMRVLINRLRDSPPISTVE